MTRAITQQSPWRLSIRDPGLRVFIPSRREVKTGVPAHEGIIQANRSGEIIASSKEIVRFIIGGGIKENIGHAFPCYSGTMSAYVESGKSFRQVAQRVRSIDNEHYIVYTNSETNERWLYHVKKDLLDHKDAVLVCNHPDFSFVVEGRDRIIKPSVAGIVMDFPTVNGHYLLDLEYGIPHGKELPRDNIAGHTLVVHNNRRTKEWVGPVCHGHDFAPLYVCLANWTADDPGMVVIDRPKARFDDKPNGQNPYREMPSVIEDNGE